jgi:hypothetical protein
MDRAVKVEWIKRHPVSYTAVTVAALLIAWEAFARQFTLPPPNPAPLDTLSLPLYSADAPAADRAKSLPRVLILGNSQVHYVRDQEDVATYGFPARLQAELAKHHRPAEIADLSAGGQQVAESLAILVDTFGCVRPDHVVLGLGLANMRGTTIPAHLVKACDWNRIRAEVTGLLDERTTVEAQRELLHLYHPPQETTIARELTIQEQLDEQFADWLTDHTATVRHRTVMSQWVTKLPSDLEREVRMTWRKQVKKQFKARTYDAGPNYALSLTTVQLMAEYCRRQRVPFTVILMPYQPRCTPIVYVQEDEQRLHADLQQMVERGDIRRIDLSQLLHPEHFGTFADGSPDGLHYHASGHAVLAETVAREYGDQLIIPAVAIQDTDTPRR